jgi:hypothetical protein
MPSQPGAGCVQDWLGQAAICLLNVRPDDFPRTSVVS